MNSGWGYQVQTETTRFTGQMKQGHRCPTPGTIGKKVINSGTSDLASKLVRLALNWINLRLFKIRFQYILAH